MVSGLDSGGLARGHCVVFLGKLLNLTLSTQKYKWVPVNCWGKLKNIAGK